MKRKQNLFYDIIIKMKQRQDYESIIAKAYTKYDLRTSKISALTLNTILKKYKKIQQRYQQGVYDKNSMHWHQNQKRLFTWFVVCYQQLEQTSLKNQNQDFFRKVSKIFFYKHPNLLIYQTKNIEKNIKQHKWIQSEDSLLTQSVRVFGDKKWNQVSMNLFVQSNMQFFRTAKQCRQRWFNHLDSTKLHTNWTLDQDLKLLCSVLQHGKKWSKIAHQLNHQRTDHMIKNRFRALMKHLRYSCSSEEEKIYSLISEIKNFVKQQKQEKVGRQDQKEYPCLIEANTQWIYPPILGFWPLNQKLQQWKQNTNIQSIENSIGY